jgi:GNAT superfamily N-acetyltransferase
MNQSELSYCLIPLQEIERIKPLWEELRMIHAQESAFFKEYFASRCFEDRCKKFFQPGKKEVRIEIVCNGKEDIGYCIASVSDERAGEIDSIIVKEKWRLQGIGSTLMTHALSWLDAQNISERKLMAGFGRESVFRFYEKFGFYPRLVQLEQKK